MNSDASMTRNIIFLQNKIKVLPGDVDMEKEINVGSKTLEVEVLKYPK